MRRWRGLYAITSGDPEPEAAVAQAIRGGAVMIQYRDKSNDQTRRMREATALASICRNAGVPFIINDDPKLARAAGANGVHLGRDDPDLAEVRAALGADAIIGVSCYAELERARQAVRAGADYVAFGRFFPSATKPEATPVGLDLLGRARAEIDLPLVAIGGVTPQNGASLIAAGADLLAVVHGVFGQTDVLEAARAYTRLFIKGDGMQ